MNSSCPSISECSCKTFPCVIECSKIVIVYAGLFSCPGCGLIILTLAAIVGSKIAKGSDCVVSVRGICSLMLNLFTRRV